MDECTEKIQELRELIDEEELDVDIQVDGGINDKTINLVNTADIAVVGSYITTSDNMIEKVKTLV